jgi:hypothetical protein
VAHDRARRRRNRIGSDEYYVLDLCDQILRTSAKRGHGFDFLRGDPDRRGTCRRLPVDAYYEDLNLVVEYHERQHTEDVPHFDKPARITVSGMPRGPQRKRYDQRRGEVLPAHGLKLIVIPYSELRHNGSKRLLRDRQHDLGMIEALLAQSRRSAGGTNT